MKLLNGLSTDTEPIDQPEGTYRDALNIVLSKKYGAITNEEGNSELIIPSLHNLEVISTLAIGRDILIFGKSGAQSNLVVLDTSDNTFTPVVGVDNPLADQLNFGDHIQAVWESNYKGDRIVYWVDELNPPRYLNLDEDLPDSIIKFNLFPYTDSAPIFGSPTINATGGSVKTGTYIFAAKYVDDDETPTNYISISEPVHIALRDNVGSRSEISSNRSISFTISNVSTEYKHLRVAVIPIYSGIIADVQLLPEIPISEDTASFTYTATETAKVEALENIQIDNAAFANAKTIAIHDRRLYLGNLTDNADLGYQKFANSIKVEPVIESLPGCVTDETSPLAPNIASVPVLKNVENGVGSITNQYKYRGYKRDEVYAFYISWLLKDGTESRAYHIPGIEADELIDPNNAEPAKGTINILSGAVANLPKAETPEITIVGGMDLSQLGNQLIIDYTLPDNSTEQLILEGGQNFDAQSTFVELTGILGNIEGFDIILTPTPLSFKVRATTGGAAGNNIKIEFSGNQASSVLDSTTEFNATGGSDTPSNNSDVEVYIDTPELPEFTKTVSLSFGDNPEDTATDIVTALNTDSTFNDKYTASNDGALITITADSLGFDYIGTLVLLPLTSGVTSEFTNLLADDDPRATFNQDGLFGKRYQFTSSDSVLRMGYWENQNEVYPDGDDWKVFTVDGSGTPVDTGKVLSGTPVRHHKFPSMDASFIVSPGNEYRVMGFRLNNVTIPNDLKEKVTGYKVYRAVRNTSDKTIIDQSYVHVGAKDGDKLVPNNITSVTPTNAEGIYYLHPFKNLITDEPLSAVSHLKTVVIAPFAAFSGEDGGITKRSLSITTSWGTPPDTEVYRKVDGIARVDTANVQTEVSLTANNITIPIINNFLGEKKIVVQLNESLDPQDSDAQFIGYLSDMCIQRSDVYRSFDKQFLVDTGYIQTDLNTKKSSPIFAGDTYISALSYRVNSQNQATMRNVIVESEYNPALRLLGDLPWETFFPATTLRKALDSGESGGDRIDNTNYFAYNTDVGFENIIKPALIYPKRIPIQETYPWRVIRSGEVSGSLKNNLRLFLQDDFTDLPKTRGQLIKLGVFNNILIPHMRYGLLRTKGREELQIDDVTAFLGSGDIFTTNPDEFVFTDNGFAGLSSIYHSLNTQFGYYFVDVDNRKIFMLNNEGLNDISNTGLSKEFEALINSDSSVRLGFDPIFNRILTTIDSETYSYYPSFGTFGSKHSYTPDKYLSSYYVFYSFDNDHKGKVYQHHLGDDYGEFYGTQYDSMIEFVDNRNPTMRKIARSVQFNTDVRDGAITLKTDTFSKFRIYNQHHDSGTKNIVYFDESFSYLTDIPTRRTRGSWFVNGFRDESSIPEGTPADEEWMYQRRIEGHYVIVNLTYNNQHAIYLYDAEVNYKQSIR